MLPVTPRCAQPAGQSSAAEWPLEAYSHTLSFGTNVDATGSESIVKSADVVQHLTYARSSLLLAAGIARH